jgi:hypothetical protein
LHCSVTNTDTTGFVVGVCKLLGARNNYLHTIIGLADA